MRRLVLGLAVGMLALPACDGKPIPSPPPPPTLPTPTPTPSGPPQAGYDCLNPPSLSGLVKVEEPIQGQYIVVLKKSSGVAPLSVQVSEVKAFAQKFSALSDVHVFSTVRAFSAKATAESIAKVASDPGVEYVQEEGRVSVRVVPWGLDRVDQRDLPLDGNYSPGADGAGVHVVIGDTGIDLQHAEFSGRLGESFVASGIFGTCQDGHYHGTHVAGTVGGTTYGIAKGATLHCDRVLNDQGSGTTGQVVQGIDFATKLKRDHPDWDVVMNMSLGGSAQPALDQAVCNSIAAGVTHVVAAGNDGSDACQASPARVRQAITVGASDDKDKGAYFSNTGSCVDLFAPGVGVLSAQPGGGQQLLSGTSMASPHVAGGAALYLSKHHGASPDQVKGGLLSKATPGRLSSIGTSANLLLYVKD